jgi:hypothetical protein
MSMLDRCIISIFCSYEAPQIRWCLWRCLRMLSPYNLVRAYDCNHAGWQGVEVWAGCCGQHHAVSDQQYWLLVLWRCISHRLQMLVCCDALLL